MLSSEVQRATASDVFARILSLYTPQGAKYDSGKLLQSLCRFLPPSGVKNITFSFLNFYAGGSHMLDIESLVFKLDEKAMALLAACESDNYALDASMVRRKVDAYADLLVGELFVPLRGIGGQTPPGTPTENEDMRKEGEDFLDYAHFIPQSVVDYPNVLRLFDMLDPGIFALLAKVGVDSLENTCSLMHSLRLELNYFWMYFEAVPHCADTYDIKWTRHIKHNFDTSDMRRHIRDHSNTNLPTPHPRLLAFHATCAKVLQISGAGDYIENLLAAPRESQSSLTKVLEPLILTVVKKIPPLIKLKV